MVAPVRMDLLQALAPVDRDATFAQVYGRVAIAHHRQVALSQERLSSFDLALAAKRGRETHSTYVLCGTIDTQASVQVLTVKIAAVADGSVVWSNSYPLAGADPAKIAADVESKVPSLAED